MRAADGDLPAARSRILANSATGCAVFSDVLWVNLYLPLVLLREFLKKDRPSAHDHRSYS
jgi:hypothetical protein